MNAEQAGLLTILTILAIIGMGISFGAGFVFGKEIAKLLLTYIRKKCAS